MCTSLGFDLKKMQLWRVVASWPQPSQLPSAPIDLCRQSRPSHAGDKKNTPLGRAEMTQFRVLGRFSLPCHVMKCDQTLFFHLLFAEARLFWNMRVTASWFCKFHLFWVLRFFRYWYWWSLFFNKTMKIYRVFDCLWVWLHFDKTPNTSNFFHLSTQGFPNNWDCEFQAIKRKYSAKTSGKL